MRRVAEGVLDPAFTGFAGVRREIEETAKKIGEYLTEGQTPAVSTDDLTGQLQLDGPPSKDTRGITGSVSLRAAICPHLQ